MRLSEALAGICNEHLSDDGDVPSTGVGKGQTSRKKLQTCSAEDCTGHLMRIQSEISCDIRQHKFTIIKTLLYVESLFQNNKMFALISRAKRCRW